MGLDWPGHLLVLPVSVFWAALAVVLGLGLVAVLVAVLCAAPALAEWLEHHR